MMKLVTATWKLQRIQIITLGCSKNIVDSERLARQLQIAGHTVIYENAALTSKTPEHIDSVLINTCGFIGDAKEESIATILNCVSAKQDGLVGKIYVFGCLSQRYEHDLREEIPEVDAFFGVRDFDKIVKTFGNTISTEMSDERYLSTPSHYAYLKISEGCNWGCSYCAIPLIRGKHVSAPMECLISEVQKLASAGVKELLVVAQDTTFYGMDLYAKRRIGDLLNRISEVNEIEWIRLHYTHPVKFPEELMAVLRDNPKVCKYLDIPLQHISDKVLKNMRRGINGVEIAHLMERLRKEIPGISLRTTFMVGHPGEDERAFSELKQFIKEVRFERLGVFCYSEEEDTYGAAHFPDTVSQVAKEVRRSELMELQAQISEELNKAKTGQLFRTIIDRQEGDFFVGRTEYDSPEVDGEVLIEAKRPLSTGAFYNVRITSADEYDLYGEVC